MRWHRFRAHREVERIENDAHEGATLDPGDMSTASSPALTPSSDAGLLTLRQTVFDDEGTVQNMAGPTALAASQDDRYVYVAANLDNAISIFRRLSSDPLFGNGFESP